MYHMTQTCPRCNGSGRDEAALKQVYSSDFNLDWKDGGSGWESCPCPDCHGTGHIDDPPVTSD
jgi:hypothetical protein